MKKKTISFFCCLVLIGCLLSIGVPAKASTAGVTRDGAVAWAVDQIGKSLDSDGYPSEQPYQCVDLIVFYYQALGAVSPGGNAIDYKYNDLPSGWQRITYTSGVTAQPGDIAVWSSTENSYGHVAIVYNADETAMNVIEQNFNNEPVVQKNWTDYSNATSHRRATLECFIRPDFADPNQLPIGHVDSISGDNGKLHIYGWAWDPDTPSKNDVELDVYIGADGYHGGTKYVTYTNGVYRPEVSVGGGEYHGFDLDIPVNERGSQPVYIYAIDTSDWQKNTLIYSGTVNIKEVTYTVSYDANGGTGAPAAQTKTHGVDLTLSSTKPTRSTVDTGSYTVTLNANGGACDTASLTAACTTSYTFKNWNTKANGSGTSYNAGAIYSANASVTLYAQWNSSTTAAAVTLPTPTRDGFVFKGWAANSTATSGFTGSYTPTGNVTLYAIWEKDTQPPVIVTQPESISVAAGKTATFTVAAEGSGLTYQWFVQLKGSEGWEPISSATKDTLSFTADSVQNGRKYRCEVSNANGTVSSEEATLTVLTKPKITTQPKAASVKAGKKVTFKVKATGGELKYQWYCMKAGTKKWVKLSGKTKATYSFKATKKMNGYKYYCLVSNKAGKVKSKTVKLTVK